jgi:hypothetical protein
VKGKPTVVLRLLKANQSDLVSRDLGVTAAPSAWNEAFLAAAQRSSPEGTQAT